MSESPAVENPSGYPVGTYIDGNLNVVDVYGTLQYGIVTAREFVGSGAGLTNLPGTSPYTVLPSGDTTGVTDTTAINAITEVAGGVVRLGPGIYYIKNILMETDSALIGCGDATQLSVVTGTTGDAIALKTPSSTRRVLLMNFLLECNNITLIGIYLNNAGLSAATPGQHRLINVTVSDAAGLGSFYYQNGIETFSLMCTSVNAGGYGFYATNNQTDSRWVQCTSAQSVEHGFIIQGNNNHFSQCKAYYAGYVFPSTWATGYYGFLVQAPPATVLHTVTLSQCEAQDTGGCGFFFDNQTTGSFANVQVVACTADSCNAGGASTYLGTGYYLNALNLSSFTGNGGYNRSGGAGTMTGLYTLAGTMTGTVLAGNNAGGMTPSFTTNSPTGYSQFEPFAVTTGGAMLLKEVSAPSTPTGYGYIYVDNSGNLYYLSPGGTSTKLASN